MNGGSQVHIFWGAPVISSEMTVPQESTFLTSTTDSWEKIQLFYDQHSLHQKDEECKQNVEYDQVADAVDPTDPMNKSADLKDKFLHCISETQDLKSEKTDPFEINVATNSDAQIYGFKNVIWHLTEEENCQKHFSEIKKITSEQHKDQSNKCGQNFQNNSFQLSHKLESLLDLECDTEHIRIGPGATETKCISTEHHEIENESLKLFSSKTVDKPSSAESVKMVSDRKISTDTEFLGIMISSQVAFLTQKEYERQNFISKEAINLTESKASDGELGVTEEKLTQPKDDLAEGCEGEQTQVYSLELFSPVYPDRKSCHSHIESDKDLKGNTASHQVFTSEDKVPPNEMYIESYNSGILYSQVNTFHKSSVKRRCTSQDKTGLSKAQSEVLQVTKKIKLVSSTRDSAVAVNQKKMYGLKGVEKTSLIKDCFSKSQKYNCLVMVLSPCHVKEITIKSGPNSGSKVPLATIVVIDQSEIQKKVFLWRTAAFWALTLFLGDIILLTDVTIHEDQWVGDTVLQSTFTSELLNLGNYSSVQPEKYSSLINGMVLQDLLLYVSSKHSYLRDLPQRQSQRMNRIEFVELEQLQPDILVHAVLRVVDITILTEALYSYRGQKQRKVMLTVEQTQGQHYVLVLWGPGAAWYPQLQRKKDFIWEFKYLYVQRNCILRKLELHTTYWSSCECLFDDDVRVMTFKAKFQKNVLSLVKMSDLATHLDEKCSGVIFIKARIIELVFPVTAVQKITLNASSSLKSIYFSLPSTIYTGCAKCETELEIDENKIYKQCFSCLPLTMKKIYYRSALMTITDGKEKICVHVGSKMIEKILLNIPPDWHNKIIAPSLEVTYGMVVADLFHSLVVGSGTPCTVKMQSLFVLDENSYPLQREFSLLGFHPDSPVK